MTAPFFVHRSELDMIVNNAPFGIDHPLITVRDLQRCAANYEALGFDPTPPGHHPWGTSNRLIIFDGNFLELITLRDPALLTAHPDGARHFGRHIEAFQKVQEGVSLVALHSRGVDDDAQTLQQRGYVPSGRVEFRRPVRLPDGQRDEAVVTLLTLIDEARLGLSHFLCHQHKPQMVWNPQWSRHRNGARRIVEVAYAVDDLRATRDRFERLYGPAALEERLGGFDVSTGGRFVVRDGAISRQQLAGVPFPIRTLPGVVAITVATGQFEQAAAFARQAGCGAVIQPSLISIPPAFAGNLILRIAAG